jgi:uncharacterized membrane protein YbhN (UPF0104 family)
MKKKEALVNSWNSQSPFFFVRGTVLKKPKLFVSLLRLLTSCVLLMFDSLVCVFLAPTHGQPFSPSWALFILFIQFQ